MAFPLPLTRTANSKPAIKQIWEMINLGSRLVATPNDYISHRLYQQEKDNNDALRFLSGARARELQNALNSNPQKLENKLEYAAHYGGLGLPVPPTLAVIGTPKTETPYLQVSNKDDIIDFLKTQLDQGQHIVIKESAGMQGAGVLVIVDLLEVEGQHFLLLSNGETKKLNEAVSAMSESPNVFLVQERLKQHEALSALNPTSLNTLRVGTFLNRDGSVYIDHAVLRIGREYSQIDTYNMGGVGVRVDVETGQLSEFGHQKPRYSREPIGEHPDSKVRFGDVQIPFWDDVLALAEKFAANSGRNRFVGWDVAISPSGPVFVEGNHYWDANFAQIGEVGLLSDSFIARLYQEADLKISATEMPSPQPLRAIRLLRSSQ